mmetsp:Transcript_18379/g.43093  ORF Transcript_18379/g.43093 Transcript_18379/m.43093 type:complete len:203 (-) Transcript_18379:1583-2191(-)
MEANSESDKLSAASTSRLDDVTPPLFALASLNITTPAFSTSRRASGVKKRLAPSTTYLKRRLPSGWNRKSLTDSTGTAAGRPPQGTKKSPEAIGDKWNRFRNDVPFSTKVPSGNVTSLSSHSTRKPRGDSTDLSTNLTILRSWARRTNSSRLIPSGSYRTPLPSTIANVGSLPSKISLEPKSPSGPPVCILRHVAASSDSLR